MNEDSQTKYLPDTASMIVIVRGSGDVGSAVAHCLFQHGFKVLIHDTPSPSATRRMMAFTDAIFDGKAALAGVSAERIDDLSALPRILSERRSIAVVTHDFDQVLHILHPDVLVDARMRKHHQPEVQIHLARLTIGLGPNFEAGITTHLAIETAWGDELGKIISKGNTHPLSGEPQTIAGHARDRYVYAPQRGVFRSGHRIGDRVGKGQPIAFIGELSLAAPLSGLIRGLTRDGVEVEAGTKVIEVDPRLEGAQIAGIGQRPGRIAQGVLEAVQNWIAQGQNSGDRLY